MFIAHSDHVSSPIQHQYCSTSGLWLTGFTKHVLRHCCSVGPARLNLFLPPANSTLHISASCLEACLQEPIIFSNWRSPAPRSSPDLVLLLQNSTFRIVLQTCALPTCHQKKGGDSQAYRGVLGKGQPPGTTTAKGYYCSSLAGEWEREREREETTTTLR